MYGKYLHTHTTHAHTHKSVLSWDVCRGPNPPWDTSLITSPVARGTLSNPSFSWRMDRWQGPGPFQVCSIKSKRISCHWPTRPTLGYCLVSTTGPRVLPLATPPKSDVLPGPPCEGWSHRERDTHTKSLATIRRLYGSSETTGTNQVQSHTGKIHLGESYCSTGGAVPCSRVIMWAPDVPPHPWVRHGQQFHKHTHLATHEP